LTFALFSCRIFVLMEKGERNVTRQMGVSAYATAQVVTEGGDRTTEAANEAVELVAQASDSTVCHILRAWSAGQSGRG
jgi:hypothetical protein